MNGSFAAPRFDFFQAVRVLERDGASSSALSSDVPANQRPVPVGSDGPAAREPVRFHAQPTLGFPAAPIVSIVPRETLAESSAHDSANGSKLPPDMTITFMSMAGAGGVLPDHYTSLLIERVRYKDVGLRDFLDLFNHRLISLFYRAGKSTVLKPPMSAAGLRARLLTRCARSIPSHGSRPMPSPACCSRWSGWEPRECRAARRSRIRRWFFSAAISPIAHVVAVAGNTPDRLFRDAGGSATIHGAMAPAGRGRSLATWRRRQLLPAGSGFGAGPARVGCPM